MATTQPTTTFSSLNTDVQNYLAEFLDNPSLLSMRQVNREVSRNIESEFIKRFFTKREHLVTVHSLRALAAITAVPSLTAKLQELRFVPMTPGKHRPSGIVVAERRIPDSSSDLDGFVHTIFQNLSSQGISPALTIAVECERFDDSGFEFSFGSIDFHRRFPRSWYFIGDATQIFTLLLENVAKTRFNMTNLTIADLPEDAMKLDGLVLSPAMVASLSKLKWLSLGIDGYWARQGRHQLLEFMSAASNVSELKLSSMGWDLDPAWLGAACANHRILSLSLQHVFCGSLDLVEVLEVHRAHVRRLDLTNVFIDGGDCYSPVFEYIGQNCTLEKVSLCDLRVGDPGVGDPETRSIKDKSVLFEKETQISLSGEIAIEYALLCMVEAGVRYKEDEEARRCP